MRRRTTRPASRQIYVDCGVPCLPVALNSGLFWPRRTFMRYPGTLVVEFLDPLPPGLPTPTNSSRAYPHRDRGRDRPARRSRAQEQAQLFGRVPSYRTVKALAKV